MPRDDRTNPTDAQNLEPRKPLPEDAEEWWRDWYEIEKKPNPVSEKIGKKGEVSLVWDGPKDAPGLLGYPWVVNTPVYSPDGKTVLSESLMPAEGIFPFRLRVVGKADAYHCIVVVREDVYEAD